MHNVKVLPSRRSLCIAMALIPVKSFADLFDDYINSTSKHYFVSFLGRKGTTATIGHSFVGIGIQIEATLRVYERLFGLYPRDGALAAVKSVLTKTSGKIDQSWDDITWDTELFMPIDEAQRKLVLAKFQEWSSNAPKYALLGNGAINCSGLVAEVAKLIGLKVPDGAGTTRPWKYIESLKKAN